MKKLLFLLILLGLTNLECASKKPAGAGGAQAKPKFLLTIPPRGAVPRAGVPVPGWQQQAEARAREHEAHQKQLIKDLNIFLAEIAQSNSLDAVPKDMPLTYDDANKCYVINSQAFTKLDYKQQQNVIRDITLLHHHVYESRQKTHRVQWPDNSNDDDDTEGEWEDVPSDDQQDFETIYQPERFPAKAMFKMHGWPLMFGKGNGNSTKRGGSRKPWYEKYNLTEEEKNAYRRQEMNRRDKTPLNPEEEGTLQEMRAEGTRTEWDETDKTRYFRLEHLRQMYPEIFSSKKE